jgi:hypothetical protein
MKEPDYNRPYGDHQQYRHRSAGYPHSSPMLADGSVANHDPDGD